MSILPEICGTALEILLDAMISTKYLPFLGLCMNQLKEISNQKKL